MPVYDYVAIDTAGKKLKGTIEADSLRAARQKLRSNNLFPTDINEASSAAKEKTQDITRFLKSDRISLKDLAILTRQLSTLLNAGLPLVSALNALSDQSDSPTVKRTTIAIKEKVEEGTTLAKALALFPASFPKLYINMVSSGEASGKLDTVLLNMASYLESQLALRNKVRSAITYPTLMLFFSTVVVIVLFIFVIPKITDMFSQQNLTLPLATVIMITISNFLIGYWWAFPVLIVASLAGLKKYYATEKGRALVDRFLLNLPIFGTIYLKVATARVALTLSALLASGVQLLAALDITRKILSNIHIENALQSAKEGVQEGRSLAKELKNTNIFPSMLCHMIAVGEQSGDLEGMLAKAGSAYESDVNATVEGLTSILEPILMIVVGVVVFSVVISVLLPMADLIDQMQ